MGPPIDENETRELEKLVQQVIAVLTAGERLALVERLYQFLRELNGPRPLPH
jgi:hypothetical protein